MLVKIFSGAVNGIEATTITLEVNILNGSIRPCGRSVPGFRASG